ncbi:sugar phosphate isomerase/epimerase [Paenibacillus motobuensis]|uniref:sugar phosphate isomerase/epimerase family protein n=1 Tax=Paenibacillus TaxID=44249 RepID=UPI00203E4A4F|nr:MULTISPECIES: sugar phosphate isomerase/epimerase family protein [Paenibacillus]MCM3038386.1 sugar phosphate isomerase/epimerase [Paenibacillus lutimineralis]MCM3645490.1 sugar phosphate isomerase/epimerase [Paenibacillus motobuensis]
MPASEFTLTGFADEIDENFVTQLQGLSSLNIRFIEIRGVNGKNISTLSPPEIREVQNRLEDYGIRVSSIGSPIGKITLQDDFGIHLDMAKRIFETARTLNSPFVRIFSFYIPQGSDAALYRNEVMERIGAILEAAKGSGLTILHENEKEIYGDIPERCLELLETFDSPHFACAFDPANFVQCSSESYPAYEMLKPYIKYVHIKDALAEDGRNVPAGMGAGRIEEVLQDLKANGYNGFLSLEPHLGSFTGLHELENTSLSDTLEASGLHSFRLAHSSLLHILNRI